MSVNVPNYNAEVAPPEVRGGLVALQQLAIVAGIMISFWIDYGTNYIGGTGASQSNAAWLVPICLQLVPGLILGAGMVFMPFSPRWLTHHNREEEAQRYEWDLNRNTNEGEEKTIKGCSCIEIHFPSTLHIYRRINTVCP